MSRGENEQTLKRRLGITRRGQRLCESKMSKDGDGPDSFLRRRSSISAAARILGITVVLFVCLAHSAYTANDPGHDSLYVLRVGDTNITGSINLTGNVTASLFRFTNDVFGDYLSLVGNGTVLGAPSTPRIMGASGALYIDSTTNLYIATKGGTTGLIQVGDTATNGVTLNVSGVIRQQGVAVCLANGSNCPVVGGSSSAGGWLNDSTATRTQLQVVINNSNGAGGSLLVQNTSGSAHLFVNGSSGYVGIGTDVATVPLHVVARSAVLGPQARFFGSNYAVSSSNVSGEIELGAGLSGVGGQTDLYFGRLSYRYANGDESFQIAAAGAGIALRTSTAGQSLSSASTRLVVTHDGKIGIGTVVPITKLESATEDNAISNTTTVFALTHTISNASNGTAGTGAAMIFRVEDSVNQTENISMIIGNLSVATNGSENGDLQFLTRNATGLFERVRVKGDGDVNITTGNLFLTGALTLSGANRGDIGSLIVKNTSGSTHLFVNGTSGFVGIGTATTPNTLTVGGTANITGATYIGNTKCAGGEVLTTDSVTGLISCVTDATGGSSGGGWVNDSVATRTQLRVVVNSSNGTGGSFVVQNTSGSAHLFVNGTSGNVGIRTTSPSAHFEVLADYGNGVLLGTTGNGISAVRGFSGGGVYGGGGGELRSEGYIGLVPSQSGNLLTYNVGTAKGLWVANTGDVLIGIGTPLATLHVNSSNPNGSFLVQNTSGSAHLFVNGTSGNVGLGTATPGNIRLYVNNNDTGNATQAVFVGGNYLYPNDVTQGQIQIGNGARIGYNSGSGMLYLDTLLGSAPITMRNSIYPNAHFSTYGADPYVTIGPTAQVVPGVATLLVNSSNERGSFRVMNYSGSTHLFVNGSSGNVGIGTIAPQRALEISGTDSAELTTLRLSNTAWVSGQLNTLEFYSGTPTGSNLITSAIKSKLYGGGANGELQFWTNNENTLTQQMVILNNGAVGIGTATPTQNLTVNGTANITGKNWIGGNTTYTIPAASTTVCFERFVGTTQNYTRCINSSGSVIETVGNFAVD